MGHKTEIHHNNLVEVAATVTEDEEEKDESEKDAAPDDNFTVPSNITGL